MQKKIVTSELVELAKTYFVIREGNTHANYIGPEGEYQKWYYAIHKDHKAEVCKEWRINNRERDLIRHKRKGKQHAFKDKIYALQKVSGLKIPECCKCGMKDIRVLTINHINGDGAIERGNRRVSRTHRQIRLGRGVEDLDVRCYNCNILYEYERGRCNLPLNWKELYESGTQSVLTRSWCA